jgi:squalene synthase HpnC
LTRRHYENFPVVSWLLPRRFRRHFYNVYAYCRWADDLADEVAGVERSERLLAWWKEQLGACYGATTSGGRSTLRHPVFVALEKTISECQIPAQPFEDLISAFVQDQRGTESATFSQLLDYCRRSANPVGRLVLYVVGRHDEQCARWSDSICTGLQLANFWQDAARDLDIGRVYLPVEDRLRFGYSDHDLQARATNEAFLELMRFETARAREFLTAGLPLVARLPVRLGVDIELFVRGGLAILDRIQSIDYRVWETRPVVTKWDVLRLTARCTAAGLSRGLKGLSRQATAAAAHRAGAEETSAVG